MAGLQEDNKSLKQGLSKVEMERKQAQEKNNNLEKVGIRSHNCSLALEKFAIMIIMILRS